MRSILAVLALLPLSLPAAAQEAGPPTDRSAVSGLPLTANQQGLDLQRLTLDLWIDPAKKHVRGRAEYWIEYAGPARAFEFELDSRYTVTKVYRAGQEVADDIWHHRNGWLTIPHYKEMAPGDGLTLIVEYEGTPREAPNAPWDGGFVWATTPAGEPWIATAMQANGCDLLYPCIDHPQKEIARIYSKIWLPEGSGLVAAGNGSLYNRYVFEGWEAFAYTARQPNTYAIALNIAPYETIERTHVSPTGQRIPLIFYHLPGDEAGAARLVDELARYIDWFERRIGPYPFADEKAGIAQTPHLGMEHQTINGYGNGFRVTAEPYDWLLFHEFAHEWFANQMTNRTQSDMWLHEGFASYMEALYLRDVAGANTYHAKLAEYRRRIGNDRAVAPRSDVTTAAYLAGDSWGTDIYFKGAWVLHSLRELIGDEAFFRSLTRLIYDRVDPNPGRYDPILRDTDQFLAIVEQESGHELDWIFEAYLRQPNLPKLTATRDGRWLDLQWMVPAGMEFPMPVEVRIGDRTVTAQFAANRARIDLGEVGALYTLDPHSKILREDPAIVRWQASRTQP